MSTVKFLTATSAGSPVVTLPCPAGKTVRLISVQQTVALGGADQVLLILGRSQNLFLIIATGNLDAATTQVGFFVGGTVLGALSAGSGNGIGPLPEAWWDFELVVSGDAQASSMIVAYEERDAEPPRERTRP